MTKGPRRFRALLAAALVTVSILLVPACSDDSGGTPSDAGTDGSQPPDLDFPDRNLDTGADPDVTEVGPDLAGDVASDSLPEDVVFDQGGADAVDDAADTGDDAGLDVGAEAGVDSGGTCVDGDGDGFGEGCEAGSDCDDADKYTYLGAPQICDGNDNTCGGVVPDDEADGDGDFYVACSGFTDWQGDNPDILGGNDCDDGASGVVPGAGDCPEPPHYLEDFERDDGGWSTFGANSSWEWGTPANTVIGDAASGSNAWVTNLDGPYNDGEQSWLLSPPFDFSDLTGDPILRFSHNRQIEGFDGAWVEVSSDGTTWAKLGASGEGEAWYNDPFDNWWSDDSPGWTVSEHFMIGAAGQSEVRFRVAFLSDANIAEEGFGLDDVAIFADITDIAVTGIEVNPEGCGVTTTTPVSVVIENLGTESVTDITVTLLLDDTEIATETVPGTLVADARTTYDFLATLDLTAGAAVRVEANADGDLFPGNDDLEIDVSDLPLFLGLPYIEDFELGDGGWFTYGSNSSWERGRPDSTDLEGAFSGEFAWVTNPDGSYNSNESSYLQSPCMNFSDLDGDPLLSFGLFYATEAAYDEAWLEMSTNGGSSWTKVLNSAGSRNWYNDTTNRWWDGDLTDWVGARVRLQGAGGEGDVRLRFAFSSDGSVTDDGIGIDEVLVSGSELIDVSLDTVEVNLARCVPGSAETVTVGLTNRSTTALSEIPIELTVNGDVVATESFTGTLAVERSGTFTFAQTIDLSIPGEYLVVATLLLDDDARPDNDSAEDAVSNVSDVTSVFPYDERFETGPAGWFTYGQNSSWEWGTPAGTIISSTPDGDNGWVQNLDGDYNRNEESYLEGPCLDLTELVRDPLFSFDHIYETENCCDEGWLEMSFDAGESWTKVVDDGSAENWYDDTARDEWDGSSGGWRRASTRLVDAAGRGDVRLRFGFDSNPTANEDEGFGVDAVRLEDDLRPDAAVLSLIVEGDRCGYRADEAVTVKIGNVGPGAISDPEVTLTLDGGDVATELISGEIAEGGSLLYTFVATADLSAPGAHTVSVTVGLAADGNPSNDDMERALFNAGRVTSLPYAESFEEGDGGFITYGPNRSWELGEPAGAVIDAAADGTQAWVTNLDGDYQNAELSYLEMTCFDFSAYAGAPTLSFERNYITEPCCDSAFVEVSTDGGASWTRLVEQSFAAGWYDDAENQWWQGSSEGWGTAIIALDGLGGEADVRMRFVMSSDDNVTAEGFAVDNFHILRP